MGGDHPDLTGRTALVTGGASGLGRAICRDFGARGAHLLVADIDGDGATDTVEMITALGGSCEYVSLDVTDADSVAQAMCRAFATHGESFDCLVNNAGTDEGARVVDLDEEQWARVIAVNQTGPMRLCREFLRTVVPRTAATPPADIVNVISISAISVGTEAGAYNSSKAALAMLTKVLQREAYEYRWPVRVHGIMPSAMNTPMMDQWQLQPEVMMDPATVAAAVRAMVTLPPDVFVQNLVINSRREPHWPR
jgi:NAD(P)-dependent dehydrogenase (short-subunit alcohol dehydrogenase family)